jgi:dihydroflavonol-4-reductase
MTLALVTGSTGFVGSSVVEALNAHGVEVRALRRATSPDDAIAGLRFTPVVGDILDYDSLRPALEGVDWVFHVAAVSDYWRTPAEVVYRVNVEGTRNMLRAAREASVARFVFTSSTAALGKPRPDKPLMDEADTFNLPPKAFPYGHSKHLAELEVQKAAAQGLNALSVLPTAVTGPRDLHFISGELIVQALKGVPFAPPGGLSYIDARDAAEAHVAAAERGQSGQRYILSGENLAHREALEIAARVVGRPGPRFGIPRWALPGAALVVEGLKRLGADLPLDGAQVRLAGEFMYYDNSKAIRELGLTTRPFEQSLRDTYAWYRSNGYLERLGVLAS